MSVRIIHDDCRAAMQRLLDEGVAIDSVVCDPPYHLESVVKRFGKKGSAPAKHGSDGRYARQSAGFMGRRWDGTDEDGTRIAEDPAVWRLVYDLLKPGGFLFAFSSPRTGHRMACAIEDVGFVMHPFMVWSYGSGFPKAHAVGKAIDKAAGAEREVVGIKPGHESFACGSMSSVQSFKGTLGAPGGFARPWMDDPEAVSRYHSLTAPATDEAAQWEGWYYGTQTLKPALEPIYMAQKPFSEKTGFANVLKHGVGAINIDACRVPAGDQDVLARNWDREKYNDIRGGNYKQGKAASIANRWSAGEGRWPANLIHDGSEAVLAMFPNSKGQQGDVRGSEPSHTGDENTNCYGEYGRVPFAKRDDDGSAARFFNCFPREGEDSGDRRYTDRGSTNFAMKPGARRKTAATPADFFNCFPLIYQAKATKADRAGSKHPTVKPVALMRHLVRLVTPAGGLVLDPFAGSGTTGQAAIEEGCRVILIEQEAGYVDDIQKRLGCSLPQQLEAILYDLL